MTDQCPKCRSDLTGSPIPKQDSQYYPEGSTHFSRIVSVYDQSRDCTVAWECPDCGWRAASRGAFRTHGVSQIPPVK
jgi:hypothetical protein